MKTKKAFTLIELLIVIAIIGMIASIILVSTSKSRGKSKDAEIMASANSIIKAAMVACADKSDTVARHSCYAGYWHYSLPASGPTATACTDYTGGGVAQIADLRVRGNVLDACNRIMSRYKAAGFSGNTFTAPNSNLFWRMGAKTIWVGGVANNIGVAFIQAWLPEQKVFYCADTNGRSSSIMSDYGLAPGYATWAAPGCMYDSPTT
jgi:prepilin-type N-terminal cleavage/methylation domain-containing protein